MKRVIQIKEHLTEIPKKINKFDFLVIGGGSAGIASGRWIAKNYKKNVCVIEHNKLGGTCVNVGCVPKKVMFNLASYLDDTNHAIKSYGLKIEGMSLDWKILKEQRDNYIKRLNLIYEDLLKENKMTYIKGLGQFVGKKLIECNGQLYEAEHILIATGSISEKNIQIEGIEHAINSDGFFDLEVQPKSVLILGGGYIGVELGQIFNSLGTKVIHLVRGQILNFLDQEVRENLEKNMKIQGYDLRLRQTIKKIEKLGENNLKVYIKNEDSGEISFEIVEKVLTATGRIPNTLGLNLDKVGIKTKKDGSIEVDEYENTSIQGVYALGDVTNKLQLTPVAIRAGRILGERIFGGKQNIKMDYENIPTVIFSHPPVGVIGLGEQQAIKKYGNQNIQVYKSTFNNMFFALNTNKNEREISLFKIICLKQNQKIIGIHANGRGVDEMLQGLAIAIKMGATKKDFDRCVAIHPTASEEFVITDPQYDE